MKRLIQILGFILLCFASAQAQTFVSGSTGADGPLDLTSGDRTVQLPASGVLNYTTVNIPAGRALTFARNLRNTPVVMLAQGDINIAGLINVSAPGGSNIQDRRIPGPGGFYGGESGQAGFGPGSGQPSCNSRDGQWIGPLSLIPIIGGSGGGGIACGAFDYSYGGGGGGAIVIASSTSIMVNSSGGIFASGAIGGGFGSGGAIRLVANAINMAGNLYACTNGAGSACGVVRLEAPVGALTFAGTSFPPAGLSSINPVIVPSTNSALNIVSIGGYPVPPNSGQRFDTYDMLLPNQLTDPISVVVQASNIPVGTQVNIAFSGSPGATFTPGTLQGTDASSTATLTISNLVRTQVTYLFVSATFDLPANLRPKGASASEENRVAKVRIESALGRKPKFIYLAQNGKEIALDKVPKGIRQHFEQ